jgi:hypothetical protein
VDEWQDRRRDITGCLGYAMLYAGVSHVDKRLALADEKTSKRREVALQMVVVLKENIVLVTRKGQAPASSSRVAYQAKNCSRNAQNELFSHI